jgi:hypothetical protein
MYKTRHVRNLLNKATEAAQNTPEAKRFQEEYDRKFDELFERMQKIADEEGVQLEIWLQNAFAEGLAMT